MTETAAHCRPEQSSSLWKESIDQCGLKGDADEAGRSGAGGRAGTAMERLELRARLRPVVQELLEADLRQRVLDQRLEDGERHRRDVRAGLRGVDHVERIADGRGEDLRLE